jgi:hypothetical protein
MAGDIRENMKVCLITWSTVSQPTFKPLQPHMSEKTRDVQILATASEMQY